MSASSPSTAFVQAIGRTAAVGRSKRFTNIHIRGLDLHAFALSSVNSPGLWIVAPCTAPWPPMKSSVLSEYPNLVTSAVPPIAAKPSAPPFTPIAFIRLTKYLLIGALPTLGSVPVDWVVPLIISLDVPFMHADRLLPFDMSAAPGFAGSRLMIWPVLKYPPALPAWM